MKVYLDNAATTAIDKEVLHTIIPFMEQHYGNPSSTHSFGRTSKAAIEQARKQIAQNLNCTPGEICFTSGGTEADNFAINTAICSLGVKHIISSQIEHHAVLHTVKEAAKKGLVRLSMVNLHADGSVNMQHLEQLLADATEKTLVALMHGNNEIGNLISLQEVGNLVRQHEGYFLSDTVQTMGHYAFNLSELPVDFLTCAAHKFHGPKGVGFLYINKRLKVQPFILGGSQEREMRGGTENLYGIVGLAKAMEVAYRDLGAHQKHIAGLKSYMIKRLTEEIQGVQFNGASATDNSLYTVLNVALPHTPKSAMMLFMLDIYGIAVSGGSACSSGSNKGSHVLTALGADTTRPNIRFSFGRFNTQEEIDFTISKLKLFYEEKVLVSK
ncbi:MAG: cysteine desulfurase family protein [Luteibaculaceae bacterium]